MAELDRTTARALVEAGYMPLAHYIEMFGDDGENGGEHVVSPATAPEPHDHQEPPVRKKHAIAYH